MSLAGCSTGIYRITCASIKCTRGTKLSRLRLVLGFVYNMGTYILQYNNAIMTNIHIFPHSVKIFCNSQVFRCLVLRLDLNLTISSMCPVTMVFRTRLSIHSIFLAVCVFFQACIVAGHIFPGCSQIIYDYREKQPKLNSSSFFIMAEACKVGVVPTTSDALLLFLSLDQINVERVSATNKNNLFRKPVYSSVSMYNCL